MVNSVGPTMTGTDVNHIMEVLHQRIQLRPDYLGWTGSLPPKRPPTIYESLTKTARDHNVGSAIDDTGEALVSAVMNYSWLAKVNLGEFMESLSQVMGVDLSRNSPYWYNEIWPLCAYFEQKGTSIIVANGKYQSAGLLHHGYWIISSLPIDVRNAVGSEDAFLAGFLTNFQQSGSDQKDVRWGTAAASSNATRLMSETDDVDTLEMKKIIEVGQYS